MNEIKYTAYYRITEHPKLDRTHRNHPVQVLALHRTPQQSHHVSESAINIMYIIIHY